MGWVQTASLGAEAHNPPYSALFPTICIWSHNLKAARVKGHADSTTDAQRNTLPLVWPAAFWKCLFFFLSMPHCICQMKIWLLKYKKMVKNLVVSATRMHDVFFFFIIPDCWPGKGIKGGLKDRRAIVCLAALRLSLAADKMRENKV